MSRAPLCPCKRCNGEGLAAYTFRVYGRTFHACEIFAAPFLANRAPIVALHRYCANRRGERAIRTCDVDAGGLGRTCTARRGEACSAPEVRP